MKPCKQVLSLGDDFGDNSTTFHCELDAGHVGPCQEEGCNSGRMYVITWRDTRSRKEKFAEWIMDKRANFQYFMEMKVIWPIMYSRLGNFFRGKR